MITTDTNTTSKTTEEVTILSIPKYLIYESLNGEALYYKGYQKVVAGELKKEDIMGSSAIQTIIISAVLRFLYKNLSEEEYEIVTNEAGLHIDTKNNLSADISEYFLDVWLDLNGNLPMQLDLGEGD